MIARVVQKLETANMVSELHTGDAGHPGSVVRVRSGVSPEPAFRGYARAMKERPVVTASE